MTRTAKQFMVNSWIRMGAWKREVDKDNIWWDDDCLLGDAEYYIMLRCLRNGMWK